MYGIIISTGILTALLVAERLAKKRGMDLELFWGSSLWLIIGGVVGARIYYVVEHWSYFAQNPVMTVQIYRGGLGIYGAILGGALFSGIYFAFKKRRSLEFLDLAAVVVPLGQAIGRWGNFVNKELFGPPTSLPWGMFVPLENRPTIYRYNDTFHPLFLYESLLDILLFFVLLLLYRRKTVLEKSANPNKPLYSLKGFFTLAYLTGYGLIRYSTEFIRIETWVINGINVTQIISLMLIVAGMVGIFLLAKKPILLVLLLSINGFFISSYLAYKKITNNALLCGNYTGCNAVQQSEYSTLLGIPLGVWGMAYYVILIFAIYYYKNKYRQLALTFWILWGLLFSSYLTFLEAFVIKAYCVWCLGTFANIILISTVSLVYRKDILRL
jgi:phosphatidylglycerol:prolipoprotein diacylglycerol transferase